MRTWPAHWRWVVVAILGLLAPLVLFPTQNAINLLNAVVAPNHNPNSKFSGWNMAGIVVGGILFGFSVIGRFAP